MTQDFFEQLKHHVRYVAWLNPMPKTRWHGTTASAIAAQIPMFEMSCRGMDRVIDILRGRDVAQN